MTQAAESTTCTAARPERRWTGPAIRNGRRGILPRKGAVKTMRSTGSLVSRFAAAAGIMLLAFGMALTASCRGADQIAPDGSTITLAANPATIVLNGGSGSSDVVATVSSSAGVPLKDQDVRFSATAGSLFDAAGDPAANIPIRTDDLGNAHVTLITTTTTTVTARSGKATGSLALSTVN